jgi:hypothetical protein
MQETEWHRYFVWLPAKIEGRWVWLRFVWGRMAKDGWDRHWRDWRLEKP